MRIVIIGSGGREHALALALKRTSKLEKIFAIPGNPGMAQIAECIALKVENHKTVIDFCKKEKINLIFNKK